MVSVCIGSYNGEKYIEEQIESILNQIDEADELIISDDGSTDSTIEIIRNYDDQRIVFVKNTKCHGADGNSVNAMEHAKGDIIFLADQDDVWLPDKYLVMKEALNEYELVHCDSIVTDDKLNILKESFYSILNNGPGIIKNIKKSTYYGSHMAFKREIYEKALPFPKTSEIGHDLWLGLVAETVGKVKFLDKRLMYYRRNGAAHCDIFEGSSRPMIVKFWGRVLMVFFYLKFRIKNV